MPALAVVAALIAFLVAQNQAQGRSEAVAAPAAGLPDTPDYHSLLVAMNLARSLQGTVWAAGHNVLASSSDGGDTWTDARPDGLPSLDVHGIAITPDEPSLLYAAVAGEGLYARATRARASSFCRGRSARASSGSRSLPAAASSPPILARGCSRARTTAPPGAPSSAGASSAWQT